jgi:hypothetical protein
VSDIQRKSIAQKSYGTCLNKVKEGLWKDLPKKGFDKRRGTSLSFEIPSSGWDR